MLAQEVDVEASGLDDGVGDSQIRRGIVILLNKGRDYGGTDTEGSDGMLIGVGSADARWKRALQLAGAFNEALLFLNGDPEDENYPQLALNTGGRIAFDHDSGDETYLSAVALDDDKVLFISKPQWDAGFDVDDLPPLSAALAGTETFARNARNSGQGVGDGSGCRVYLDAAGHWLACWSGLAVTQ